MNSLHALRAQVAREGVVRFVWAGDLVDCASSIGDVLIDPVSRQPIDHLSNSPESRANPKHLSYSREYSEISFHTDYPNERLPPRFVLLRCVDADPSVATQYASLADIGHSSFLNLFRNEPWLVFLDGRWRATRVLGLHQSGQPLLRYASNTMRPMFPCTSKLSILLQEPESFMPTTSFVLEQNDCLLIDNWLGLHRRTRVPGIKASGRPRCLERILIK